MSESSNTGISNAYDNIRCGKTLCNFGLGQGCILELQVPKQLVKGAQSQPSGEWELEVLIAYKERVVETGKNCKDQEAFARALALIDAKIEEMQENNEEES